MGRGSGTSPWLRLRSDEQLVGLFRSGSEDAFRVIHDRYRQRLYAYARQMLGGSGPDAEDVLQDVFLRAYRALRADERPVSLRAWLYRVAHNRCIDGLRRPTPAPSDVFEMSRTPVLDTTAQAERREDLQRLIADVRRLPEQQRSALLMREMDGMSYADLAVALDTSVPAIKSLLVRARIGLVEAIEARDADCADIRHDLAASYDRGVRANGRARRHLRDCDGCTSYRAQLRGVRQGFAALSPGIAAPGLVAKLLGLGGAGSGAAGAASGVGAIGGGVTAAGVSVTKVAAIVGAAAAITGGAVEVQRVVAPGDSAAPALVERAVATAGVAAPVTALRGPAVPGLERPDALASDVALHPHVTAGSPYAGMPETADVSATSGGVLAPDEPSTETPMATPSPAPAEHGPAVTEDGVILGLPESATPTATSHESTSAGTEGSSQPSAEAHESSTARGESGSSTSGSSTGSPTATGSSPSTTGGSPTAPVSPAATSTHPGS